MFLVKISQSFQSLTKAAVDGTCNDPFFGSPRVARNYNKRLRAVVQNLNLAFAEAMRLYGHSREISETQAPSYAKAKQSSLASRMISRADFIQEIRELLKTSRGRELPEMFIPLIVGDLFLEQSENWERLAREHLQATGDTVQNFLQLTLSHLTDENASLAILREIIEPVLV